MSVYEHEKRCAECMWGLARTLWLKANGGTPGLPFDSLAYDERWAWFDHAQEVVAGADSAADALTAERQADAWEVGHRACACQRPGATPCRNPYKEENR